MASQTHQPPAYQGPPPYHSHTFTKTLTKSHHIQQQLFGQHPQSEHGGQPGSTNELSSAIDQLTCHGGPVFTQCADKLLELLSLIHQQPTDQHRRIDLCELEHLTDLAGVKSFLAAVGFEQQSATCLAMPAPLAAELALCGIRALEERLVQLAMDLSTEFTVDEQAASTAIFLSAVQTCAGAAPETDNIIIQLAHAGGTRPVQMPAQCTLQDLFSSVEQTFTEQESSAISLSLDRDGHQSLPREPTKLTHCGLTSGTTVFVNIADNSAAEAEKLRKQARQQEDNQRQQQMQQQQEVAQQLKQQRKQEREAQLAEQENDQDRGQFERRVVNEVSDGQLSEIEYFFTVTGERFVDPEFRPCNESLYEHPHGHCTWKCGGCTHRNPFPPRNQRAAKCEFCGAHATRINQESRPSDWVRPESIRDDVTGSKSNVPWVVFRQEPRADDVRQGALGNCWFLCGLSILAERPKLIMKMFPNVELSRSGAYLVRLCHGGHWRTVLVDDLLPVSMHQLLAYSKAARRQLWVPLVEKAAAKLWGSYEALSSGTLTEAFSLFTGFPTERHLLQYLPQNQAFRGESTKPSENPDDHDSDLLWARLLSFHQAGFLMGFGCQSRKACEEGLQAPHAYSVQQVCEVQSHRLVKLRNPWGQNSWAGNWSASSTLWTPELKQALKFGHDDDGCCWMCWDDVARLFYSLEVCRVQSGYDEARLQAWLPSAVGLGASGQLTTFADQTNLELQLVQEAHLKRDAASESLVDLGCLLMRRTRDGEYSMFGNCERKLEASVSSTIAVPAGEYLIIPLCFNQRRSMQPRRHVIVCHSDKPLCLESVQSNVHTVSNAILQHVKMVGERSHPMQGITVYTMACSAGLMISCENTSSRWFLAEIDCSGSEGVVSSRDSSGDLLVCSDWVAPGSQQLLMVLSPKEGQQSFSYSMRMSYKMSRHGDGTADGTHVPPVIGTGDEITALHAPIPLN